MSKQLEVIEIAESNESAVDQIVVLDDFSLTLIGGGEAVVAV